MKGLKVKCSTSVSRLAERQGVRLAAEGKFNQPSAESPRMADSNVGVRLTEATKGINHGQET